VRAHDTGVVRGRRRRWNRLVERHFGHRTTALDVERNDAPGREILGVRWSRVHKRHGMKRTVGNPRVEGPTANRRTPIPPRGPPRHDGTVDEELRMRTVPGGYVVAVSTVASRPGTGR
jgi:hypothetical protein